MRDRKYALPLVPDSLPSPINSAPYHFHVPHSFYSDIPYPRELRPRPRDVERLRRYWGTTPKFWPVSPFTDCAWPLYLYYCAIKAAGQPIVAFEIIRFLRYVNGRWNIYKKRFSNPDVYEDDFFRYYLKNLSGYAYPRCFNEGPGYMLICHLHALNAKAPFTEKQIESEISSWVSDERPDGTKKAINMASYIKTLDRVFTAWPAKKEVCSFDQFIADPFRWGTKGGAPPVIIDGTKVKSKWAWALYHTFDSNLEYSSDPTRIKEAMYSTGDIAQMALKEEAQKNTGNYNNTNSFLP